MAINPCRKNLEAVLTVLERANILEEYAYKLDITKHDLASIDVDFDYFKAAFKHIEDANIVPGELQKKFKGTVETALGTFKAEIDHRTKERLAIAGDAAENALSAIRGTAKDFLFDSIGWCVKREG